MSRKLAGHHRYQECRVASFNLLCDGLSYDEFFCVEGETNKFTAWSYREEKITEILMNMFKGCNPNDPSRIPSRCSIIVTQENDHFYHLLRRLRSNPQCGNIAGVYGINTKVTKSKVSHGTGFRVKAQRLLRGANILDENTLSDKSRLYGHVNKIFRSGQLDHLKATPERIFNGDRALEVIRSFREECGDEFLNQALSIAGEEVEADDIYLSDDGIGIFYDKNVVDLVDVGSPGVVDPIIKSVEHRDVEAVSIALQGIGPAVRCLFRLKSSLGSIEGRQKYILFYGAHLKSGEGVKDAITRSSQLKLIVEDWQDYVSEHSELLKDGDVTPVFAMDSNNSKFYEEGYPAKGSMIRVPSTAQGSEDSEVEVEFCSTLSEYLEINNLVDGIHLQDTQYNGRNQCLKMRNGKTEQKSKAFQLMFDTIDKIIVPSSQPINLDCCNYFGFRTYDSSSGSFFSDVRSSKQRRAELYHQLLDNVHTACAKTAFGLDSPFAHLYPNEFAPSDHPPVSLILML